MFVLLFVSKKILCLKVKMSSTCFKMCVVSNAIRIEEKCVEIDLTLYSAFLFNPSAITPVFQKKGQFFMGHKISV